MTGLHDPQKFRCPEALHWQIGDELLVGKGDHAFLYLVVGRQSANVAIVVFLEVLS